MKKMIMLGLVLLGVLLLGGCKNTSEPMTQWGYILSEYDLPDPDACISADETKPEEKIYRICENKVVRISKTEKLEGNRYLVKWYFQTLPAPYENWHTDIIEQAIVIDNNSYVIGNCCVTPQGDIYLLVYASQEESFLVEWTGGTAVKKQQLPFDNELFFMNWEMDVQKNSYFYANEEVRIFDSTFQEKQGVSVEGEKLDLIMSPAGEAYAWRVRSPLQAKESICSFADGQELVNGNKMVNFVGRGLLTSDEKGILYLTDSQRIYQLGVTNKEVLSYVNLNIWVEEVQDIHYSKEGAFWILTSSGFQKSLLCIEEGMQIVSKKKEIVLAADGNPFLEKCIVNFNKNNKEYYVTLLDWDSNQEYYDDYCSRLQLEITTGKGPDLIDDTIINLESYAKGGYIEPLEGLRKKYGGDLFAPAVEAGCIEDKCYVLPYRFEVKTLLTLQDIVTNQEGWTLEDLQQITENNQPKALFQGARAWDIIYTCVAWDEEATTFVDWEKGTCFFNEEAFINLLHFAKAYADTRGNSVMDYEYQKMQKREILLQIIYGIDSWNSFTQNKENFGNEGIFIGYPQQDRKGHYAKGIGFALNSSSKCKEGAKDFLSYMVSEEVQKALWEDNTLLPINRKILEQQLKETELREKTEYAQEFWKLLNNCQPQGKKYENIIYILYEETGAFFSGEKEAEEVASIIQNRVQLYLDENPCE